MEKDCSAAPIFIEELLVHVLRENKFQFRYHTHLRGSNCYKPRPKPTFTPQIGQAISKLRHKYRADYQAIFDSIFGKMQKSPASASLVLERAIQQLADSLLYDREDPKKFLIFCAVLSEMFLQSFRLGFRGLMPQVVRTASFEIDSKLRWSEDEGFLYDAYLTDYRAD